MAPLLLTTALHWAFFSGSAPQFFSRRGVRPRMEAAVDVQAQMESLQAQLKILQLRAQIEELERAKAPGVLDAVPTPTPALPEVAPLPLPQLAAPPSLPALAAPLPSPAPPLPLPAEELNCVTFSGTPTKCPDASDLVDPAELLGGFELPSIQRAIDALPSPEQLFQAETLLPIVAVVAALFGGYFVTTAASQSLRPEDAATTRRRLEERERQGVSESDLEQSEWEEEQANRVARDNWIAALLIVVFELVLFSLRNV